MPTRTSRRAPPDDRARQGTSPRGGRESGDAGQTPDCRLSTGVLVTGERQVGSGRRPHVADIVPGPRRLCDAAGCRAACEPLKARELSLKKIAQNKIAREIPG